MLSTRGQWLLALDKLDSVVVKMSSSKKRTRTPRYPAIMMTTRQKTKRKSLSALSISLIAPFLLPGPAFSQDVIEPTTHYAYASFFGTGWYKINDERRAYILRVAPRWTIGEADIDDQGNRRIEYTLRVPMTLGLARLDFDDIPGIIDPDDITTASLNFSVDANVPVTARFSLRPSAEFGYATILGENGYAWTYKGEIRSRYTFQSGKLDWGMVGGLGTVGYEPNEGQSDDFTYLAAGLEFEYPVNWPRSKNDQTMLYWHVSYTDFLDEIEFKTGVEELDSVANYWQVGLAFGKNREPVRIWFLTFDRLGLAYNYSTTGSLRGIKFVFRSIYDL